MSPATRSAARPPDGRRERSAPTNRRQAMPAGSSPKRERQYEHIKASAKKRGESPDRAEEISARTVDKERARSGEAHTASRSSSKDVSSGHRGGKRSHCGAQGRTKEQLYNEAKKLGVKGHSSMSKARGPNFCLRKSTWLRYADDEQVENAFTFLNRNAGLEVIGITEKLLPAFTSWSADHQH
ncbi:hypothetical protein [Micromonospora sp. NPDC053811]|uniref:hypothetical protein n=1 Tax=Micromonospora sp. NPDC053811 TaxID=3154956 RepID=UPI003434F256